MNAYSKSWRSPSLNKPDALDFKKGQGSLRAVAEREIHATTLQRVLRGDYARVENGPAQFVQDGEHDALRYRGFVGKAAGTEVPLDLGDAINEHRGRHVGLGCCVGS